MTRDNAVESDQGRSESREAHHSQTRGTTTGLEQDSSDQRVETHSQTRSTTAGRLTSGGVSQASYHNFGGTPSGDGTLPLAWNMMGLASFNPIGGGASIGGGAGAGSSIAAFGGPWGVADPGATSASSLPMQQELDRCRQSLICH